MVDMEGKEVAGAIFGTMIKIVVVAIVVMFVYRYSVMAYDFGFRLFGEEPMTQGDGVNISVTISEDESVQKIADMLVDNGLIRDADVFVVQERLSDYHGKLGAGTYELNTSMTVEEMLAIMGESEEETEEAEE